MQPEQFRNAFSGIWWSVSTLLTVGYGDIYPVTTVGKCMAIIIGFLGVGVVAIPTGIISAGFVEQYTKIKTINSYEEEMNVRFVTVNVNDNGTWKGRTVKELELPAGLMLALILRDGEVVVPNGDTVLRSGDKIVLAAEAFQEELHVTLKEIIIKSKHPWNGMRIRDLDISRQTIILMIRRKDRLLIPHGDTRIEAEDAVILYSRHPIREGAEIRI